MITYNWFVAFQILVILGVLDGIVKVVGGAMKIPVANKLGSGHILAGIIVLILFLVIPALI